MLIHKYVAPKEHQNVSFCTNVLTHDYLLWNPVSKWAVRFISLLKSGSAAMDVNLLHIQHSVLFFPTVPSLHPKWIECRRAIASSSTAPVRARHGGTANKDGLTTKSSTLIREISVRWRKSSFVVLLYTVITRAAHNATAPFTYFNDFPVAVVCHVIVRIAKYI